MAPYQEWVGECAIDVPLYSRGARKEGSGPKLTTDGDESVAGDMASQGVAQNKGFHVEGGIKLFGNNGEPGEEEVQLSPCCPLC